MIAIPKDREDALDIVWGCIHTNNDAWRQVFPGFHGMTRRDLVRETGWSYSLVYRLVALLRERGQITLFWNHQHRSSWEGLLYIADDDLKPDGKADNNG